MPADEQAAALVCGRLRPDEIHPSARLPVIAALVTLLQAADDKLQSLMSQDIEI